MRNFRTTVLALIFAVTAAMASPSAQAQVDIPPGPLVKVKLVSEKAAVAPGGSFWVGLHMEIHPGWHTYWRNAGDAGAEAKLKWHLPPGFTADPISWPLPHRMPEGPLMTFGYEGTIFLPIKITVGQDVTPGQTALLRADVSWLVCDEICIPEDGKVSTALAIVEVGGGANTKWSEPLTSAVAHLPIVAPWDVSFATDGKALHLLVEAPELTAALTHGAVRDVIFFPYQQNVIHNPASQAIGAADAGLSLTVALAKRFQTAETVSGILVFDEDIDTGLTRRAFEFTAGPTDLTEANQLAFGVGDSRPGTGALLEISLWQAALFAFLGGIILNIMPCVFPILFIKAFGFMSAAAGPPQAIRKQGLAYTAGVVVSFASLAAVLIALRAGGAEIGWGFQLQSPLVVALLALLMLAVALSLSGVFTLGGGWTNVGSGLAAKEGNRGSFFTGILAAVIATPCTAPFMGVAIGFALAQPAFVALGVFVFLGLGMAAPYLALSYYPAAAKALPKPGHWMERAQQFLAFPMYGTAAWLVWVVSQQVATTLFLGLLLALVLFAFAAWSFGASQGESGSWARAGRLIAGLSLAVSIFFLAQLQASAPQVTLSEPSDSEGLAYRPYSSETLSTLRSEGTPVFVNFTASWCISCLVNERVALSGPEVERVIEERGIAYLKADWTNRDPEITAALAEFGRAGVPLYLYYPAGAGEAMVLPQILSEGILIDAFEARSSN